jgi:hypothetical protein
MLNRNSLNTSLAKAIAVAAGSSRSRLGTVLAGNVASDYQKVNAAGAAYALEGLRGILLTPELFDSVKEDKTLIDLVVEVDASKLVSSQYVVGDTVEALRPVLQQAIFDGLKSRYSAEADLIKGKKTSVNKKFTSIGLHSLVPELVSNQSVTLPGSGPDASGMTSRNGKVYNNSIVTTLEDYNSLTYKGSSAEVNTTFDYEGDDFYKAVFQADEAVIALSDNYQGVRFAHTKALITPLLTARRFVNPTQINSTDLTFEQGATLCSFSTIIAVPKVYKPTSAVSVAQGTVTSGVQTSFTEVAQQVAIRITFRFLWTGNKAIIISKDNYAGSDSTIYADNTYKIISHYRLGLASPAMQGGQHFAEAVNVAISGTRACKKILSNVSETLSEYYNHSIQFPDPFYYENAAVIAETMASYTGYRPAVTSFEEVSRYYPPKDTSKRFERVYAYQKIAGTTSTGAPRWLAYHAPFASFSVTFSKPVVLSL